MLLVERKVALVTGGGSGIGRATALLFAKEGAMVCVADISEKAGQSVVGEIRGHGGDALFVQADVSKEPDIIDAVEQTVGRFGGLDLAFNNAGTTGNYTNVLNCTEDEWNTVVDLNMRGIWLCMKHEIKAMINRGGGAVCNNVSLAGSSASENLFAYTATKHALVGMTRSVAIDMSHKNVRVNAIVPGPTDTDMLEEYTDRNSIDRDTVANVIPMGRLARVDEQAQAAVWLCSDRASYVQGTTLCVDGGMSALV